MKYIDLHVHSTISDGTIPPAELPRLAARQGLLAFALTDHDTVKGVAEAQAAAASLRKQGTEIHVIPGVEISAAHKRSDIHILGLDIDPENAALCHALDEAEQERLLRNRKMADNLAAAGLDISYEAIQAMDPEAIITRGHFAKYLLQKGCVSSMAEAFDKYLHPKGPYYVGRNYLSPEEAIELILNAKGIPVLAHPLLYHLSEEELQRLILRLKQAGLKGLEAIYSCYSQNEEAFVKRLAHQNGLVISGGSDFHGGNKPDISLGTGRGSLRVPSSILDGLNIALQA